MYLFTVDFRLLYNGLKSIVDFQRLDVIQNVKVLISMNKLDVD